jgi:hypothetical protein
VDTLKGTRKSVLRGRTLTSSPDSIHFVSTIKNSAREDKVDLRCHRRDTLEDGGHMLVVDEGEVQISGGFAVVVTPDPKTMTAAVVELASCTQLQTIPVAKLWKSQWGFPRPALTQHMLLVAAESAGKPAQLGVDLRTGRPRFSGESALSFATAAYAAIDTGGKVNIVDAATGKVVRSAKVKSPSVPYWNVAGTETAFAYLDVEDLTFWDWSADRTAKPLVKHLVGVPADCQLSLSASGLGCGEFAINPQSGTVTKRSESDVVRAKFTLPGSREGTECELVYEKATYRLLTRTRSCEAYEVRENVIYNTAAQAAPILASLPTGAHRAAIDIPLTEVQ